MKVLLFNGSSHKAGCTYRALQEVAASLNNCGIETEILQVGSLPLCGCMDCGYCKRTVPCDGCAFGKKDGFNDLFAACKEADGFIFGSPVYYASANGTLSSFMDRLFRCGSSFLAHKPAAAVASARRAGTTVTLDQINKYFTINQMPVVSSTYWNMVHGGNNNPADVEQDLEGLQTMRNLGRNMAWLLKCIEAGKQAGIEPPQAERQATTSFIR